MERGERTGRCIWLFLMTLTLTGLVLLYMEFNLGGEFWSDLGVAGDVPPGRERFVTAYCDELDVMVLFGGLDAGGSGVSNAAYVYDFASSSFTQVSPAEMSLVEGRYGGNLVKVDSHPDAGAAPCRFLIYGGASESSAPGGNTSTVVASDATVWAMDVFAADNVQVSEVLATLHPTLAVAPPGRFLAAGLGAGSTMLIHGGLASLELDAVVSNSVWRFQLNQSAPLSGGYEGEWAVVLDEPDSATVPRRFDFASGVSERPASAGGNEWVVHGGLGKASNGKPIFLSSMGHFNVAALVGAEPGALTSNSFFRVKQAALIGRWGHAAAFRRNIAFYYGGMRLSSGGGGSGGGPAAEVPSDYLLITTLLFGNSNAPNTTSVGCQSGRTRFAWCGFQTQYPGTAPLTTAVTRSQERMVVTRLEGGALRLHQLDMERTVLRGAVVNAIELETDADVGALEALQYALIAACGFLLLSIFILYRNRNADFAFTQQLAMQASQAVKRTGVSRTVVNALPLIRFDPDGDHVPVKRSVDAAGVESFVELPLTLSRRRRRQRQPADRSGARGDDDGQDDDGQDDDGQDDDEEEEEEKGQGQGQDEQGAGSKPAFLEDEEGELCAICLLAFETGEVLMELPCGHPFHQDCVGPWLLKKGNCPLCKAHVVTGRPVEHDHPHVVEIPSGDDPAEAPEQDQDVEDDDDVVNDDDATQGQVGQQDEDVARRPGTSEPSASMLSRLVQRMSVSGGGSSTAPAPTPRHRVSTAEELI